MTDSERPIDNTVPDDFIQKSLWPYNAYKGTMARACPHAAGVAHALRRSKNPAFFDPKDLQGFTVERDGDKKYKLSWDIPGFEEVAAPLYPEGVALAHVFGNFAAETRMGKELAEKLMKQGIPIDSPPPELRSVWDKYKSTEELEFDDLSGRMYVYAAFETIRMQSLLKLAHDTGKIDEATFRDSLIDINRQMDSIGLNGIDRMLAARPELETIIENDKRPITITSDLIVGIGTTPKGIIFNRTMPRGEYFSKIKEANPGYKGDIVRKILGNDYATAYKQRMSALREYEIDGRGSNRKPAELENIVLSSHAAPEERDAALKTYLINYGLGATHERFEEFAAKAEGSSAGSQGTLGTSGIKGLLKQDDSIQSGGTAQKKSPGESSDSTISNSSSANGNTDKSKDFIAGKIATTAVLGIGLVDGVSNLLKKKDEDPNNTDKSKDNSKDNSQTFIRALEVAAAVAGIALVWWKGDVIFKGIGNFFNKAGHSA